MFISLRQILSFEKEIPYILCFFIAEYLFFVGTMYKVFCMIKRGVIISGVGWFFYHFFNTLAQSIWDHAYIVPLMEIHIHTHVLSLLTTLCIRLLCTSVRFSLRISTNLTKSSRDVSVHGPTTKTKKILMFS